MQELVYRDRTWLYLHSTVFKEYAENFTHKNFRKIKQVAMAERAGRFKIARLKEANKLPDVYNYFKEVVISDTRYYKVPPGCVSLFASLDPVEAFNNPHVQFTKWNTEYKLRDYQEEAVNNLLKHSTGLLHAKTGTGKTVMICEIIRRLERKALIVCHNIMQTKQMVADVKKIMKVTPLSFTWTKATQKEKQESNDSIHVLNIDSYDKVNINDYWVVLFDECHKYMGSDDRRKWVKNASCEYIYWATWTPHANDIDDRVFDVFFGKKTLVDFTLLTPTYRRIFTNMSWFNNSFSDLEDKMYSDTERNSMIIDIAKECLNKWCKWLIFTKRVLHAETLRDSLRALWFEVFLLVWEVKESERLEIRQKAIDHKWPCVIVGNVDIIGTGFDFPEASFAILTTAEKFKGRIIQYVWRILRPFEWKPDPVFIDIVDNESMLFNQAEHRKRTVKAEWWEKVINSDKQILKTKKELINWLDL